MSSMRGHVLVDHVCMAEIHRWSEQTLNPMSGHVLVDYAWQKSIGGWSSH